MSKPRTKGLGLHFNKKDGSVLLQRRKMPFAFLDAEGLMTDQQTNGDIPPIESFVLALATQNAKEEK